MSEECDIVEPASLVDEIRFWWSQPFRCRFKHAYGPWQTRPTSGFNFVGQLVSGTEHYRTCRRCGRFDSYARANR